MMKKFLFTLFIAVFTAVAAFAQNADPYISTIMSPGGVLINTSGVLITSAGNGGNSSIVANSLQVVVVAGSNATITGLAAGTDPRWTVFASTTGNGNSYTLRNTAGGFTAFDIGDILLNVTGTVASSPTVITATIVYLAGNNPLLGGSPNVSQGNASTTNDNTQTSVEVFAPPVANDDVSGTALTEDGANGTINIINNDTDPNGNPVPPTNGVGQFTVDLDPGTAGLQTTFTNSTGVWTYNTATGVVTFDPANNYNGTATIPYTLCDPGGLCDPANITFTVNPVNDPVNAVDDVVATPLTEDGANGTVSILTNDTDPDGNPTAPTNGAGQFTVDLDPGTAGIQTTFTNTTGVWTYNTTTGVVTFDPANNYNGTATIPYQLCDPGVPTPVTCDIANITFTVNPVNDPPVANDDIVATPLTEDGANGTVNILTNDTDPDGNPTAPTNGVGQFTIDLDPGTAGLQTTFTNTTGVWTYNTATGVVTFDPANNYNGTATIPYTLCDATGACDPANITFTVTPVNDAVDAVDDVVATPLTEDGANGTVSILTNDTDPDGNPTAPTNGAGQFTVDMDPGTAGLQTSFTNSTGVWTYNTTTGVVTFNPANNYNGTATIPYQLCDPGVPAPVNCDIANITFTVNPVNDQVDAVDDVVATPLTEDGANGTVSILTNDTDPDGNPTAPTNGAGQFVVDLDTSTPGVQTTLTNTTGVWTYNTTTGVVTFNPATNYNGTATIPYQLCDPGVPTPVTCDVANITFTVTPVNDAVDAVDDVVATPLSEDGANGTVSILTNDTDPDGNPTAPTNGAGQFTVDMDPGTAGLQTSFTNSTGVWTYNTTTGVVTFNPANNYNGTATIPYQLCDPGVPSPVNCDIANITFTVTPVNDPPIANDDIVATPLTEDGANGTVSILTNDTDLDGNPTAPTNGAGQFTVDLDPGTAGLQTTFTNTTGVWTYNTTTGVVTFDPANNYNGTATIPYTLCDAGGLCDPANITFTVTPVNDAVDAVNDVVATPLSEDGANGTVSILTNDTDPDGNPTAPTNGAGQFTVDMDPGTAGLQTSFTNSTGVWTYNTTTGVVTFDPATNYNGTATIPYQLCDPGVPSPVNCDIANITFTVTPVNDPPIANDDIVATPLTEDGANGTVSILTNDTDLDGNPTAPTNGAGQFTVDLDPGTAGLQTTFTNTTGVWTYNTTTGVVTFDPANNYNGTATIPYTLCDAGGLCDPANITFTVTPVNDAVDAVDDVVATPLSEDGANGTVSILTNDTDPDGNPTAPTNGAGQFTVDMDPGTAGLQTSFTNSTGVWTYNTTTGVVTFNPANNYNGTATIPYQLCDPGVPSPVNCDIANITFTVTPVNDQVDAVDDVVAVPLTEDGTNGTVNILTNDTDPDGNPTAPTNGAGQFTVDMDPGTAGLQTSFTNSTGVWTYNTTTGVVTFDPATNYNGTATIPYQLCDPGVPTPATCDIANITFTVTPVNDPPVANDDIVATPLTEDGANGTVAILTNDTDPDGNPTAPTNGAGQFVVDLDTATPGVQTTLTNTTGVWTYNTTTGIVTFDPANNYNGTATIPYSLCDAAGACDPANITFTVNAVNDAVDAVDDVVATPLAEDGLNGTVAILTNDTDPDGNPTAPTNGAGQFVVDLDTSTPGVQTTFTNSTGVWTYATATGVVTFDPANNYNGTATIPYQLCDPGVPAPVNCDVANITFTVTPVNDPPVANDDIVATPLSEDGANGTVSILTNDTDIDGNPTAPTNGAGQFTVDLDPSTPGLQTTLTNTTGVWTYNTTTGVVTFDPANNYNGTATIPYTLCDAGGLCDPANITFTVTSVNDLPDAIDDVSPTPLVQDGVDGTIDIVTNDTDPDGNPTAPTNGAGQFTYDLNPSLAGIQTSFTNTTGVWTYAPATGVVTFNPAGGYSGTATIPYQMCDPSGACDIANITFNVTAIRDFTPTIEIENVTFLAASAPRDFVINISEIVNGPSISPVVLKIPKISAFTYSFSPTTTLSSIYGGTPVDNTIWTKTENALFITLTLNAGAVIPAYGIASIGMTVTRNANVPAQTNQPMTVTIVDNSGGDINPSNNTYNVVIKAQ